MTDERFFEALFQGELGVDHQDHPSTEVLICYAFSKLPEEFQQSIAAHVNTCNGCFAQVMELKQARAELIDSFEQHVAVEPANRWQRLISNWVGRFERLSLLKHTLAYAVAVLALLLSYMVIHDLVLVRPRTLVSADPGLDWNAILIWGLGIFLGGWGFIWALHGMIKWRLRGK